MNTLEQIVAFLPALWLYATFGNPFIASGLGLLWIFGRIWYAAGYYLMLLDCDPVVFDRCRVTLSIKQLSTLVCRNAQCPPIQTSIMCYSPFLPG
jgi:hypothetical protein